MEEEAEKERYEELGRAFEKARKVGYMVRYSHTDEKYMTKTFNDVWIDLINWFRESQKGE